MKQLNAWIYTQEQAAAIKNGDIEARNKFYFDNLDHIKSMARKYCAARWGLGSCNWNVDDLLAQAYLYLPYCGFENAFSISCFLKRRSFFQVAFGGLDYQYANHCLKNAELFVIPTDSLDNFAKYENEREDSNPLIQRYCAVPSAAEQLELDKPQNNNKTIQRILSAYLTDVQLDFFMLVCEGYTQAEAYRKLNLTAKKPSMSAISNKLRKNYRAIVAALDRANVEAIKPYLAVEPTGGSFKRAYKYSAEQRAKNAAHMRAWRESKKAAQLAT